MAAHFTAEMVVAMLQEELDEEGMCPGSESETSDDDDPDYLPQGQAGVVGLSGNPALLHEEDFSDDAEDSSDDAEDSSDESSEKETQPSLIDSVKMDLTGMRIPHSWQNKKP